MTPQQIINIRPVTAAVKEFFGSLQLSQFATNTTRFLSCSYKRRLSALGPGGLTRDRAGYEAVTCTTTMVVCAQSRHLEGPTSV